MRINEYMGSMRTQAQGLNASRPKLTHYSVSDLSDSHSKLGYQHQLVAYSTEFHKRNTVPANESYLFSGHSPGMRTQPQGQAGMMHTRESWSSLGYLVTPEGNSGQGLESTCGTLLQWHCRLQLVPANRRGLRKFWGRHFNAQGFQRHKADPGAPFAWV